MTDQHPDDAPPASDDHHDRLPPLDEDAMAAAVDVVGRTGARDLTFGHLYDDVPVEQAAWWATAAYQGTKITAENHAGPVEALEALARKLLTGAKCVRCGSLIALSDDGAVAYPGAFMADGTRWTEQDIRAAGTCRWRRFGPRWEPGCPSTHPPLPGDEIHTTEKLARALEELGDPRLAGMISRARAGYYHDFLSPLALPELQLIEDLRSVGHEAFARRVMDDEFTASTAESAAWSESEEGRATRAELMPGGEPVPGSPLARMMDLIRAMGSAAQAGGDAPRTASPDTPKRPKGNKKKAGKKKTRGGKRGR